MTRTGCANGRCGHQPYDTRCSDPDYQAQPCCGLRVHIDDLDIDHDLYHSENCRTRTRRKD